MTHLLSFAQMRARYKAGRTGFFSMGAASIVAMTIAGSQIAYAAPAQSDTQPAPAGQGAKDETGAADIVVTGSRIARRDFTSSSPIVTTSVEAIQSTGKVNIEDALLDMPQFSPGQGATTNSLGGGGRATLNLRGLGEQRNLILLDGKRMPISSSLNVVDVDLIPNSLIRNVEVISGGASAVYGSDAISGVVNFKTRDRMKGIEMDSQYRISGRGDAGQADISLAGGTDFAQGRGHVMVSASYSHRDELLAGARDFYTYGTPSGNVATGAASFGTNLPSQAAVNSVFGKYGYAAGTASATSAFGFNGNGSLYAVRGGYNAQLGSNYGLVNGNESQYTARDNTLISPQNRYSVFTKASFDVTPDITIYAQGLYNNTKSKAAQNWPTASPTLTIPATNPFIPADLATLLASRSNPNASFTLAKRFSEIPKRYYVEPFETYQILGGVKGKINSNLSFDIYASHDETVNREELTSAVRLSRLNTLLNASDGGKSICEGGYNPFGAGNTISQACLNYITASVHNYQKITQNIVEGTLSGKILTLPADDLRFSLTASYRDNGFTWTPDALLAPINAAYQSDLSATTSSLPTTGKINVKEISGELLVPIFRDQAFAKSLNLSLGYRYSDYNVTGGASTYKAELDWRPVQALLLRGGYEHAIRAPNIGELFSASSGSVAQLGSAPAAGDPCDIRFSGRNAQLTALCVATGIPAAAANSYTLTAATVQTTVSGNATLKPEVADTFTAGFVLAPRWSNPFFSNMSLSVDYYNISIKNAISPIAGSTVMSKCYNLDGSNPGYDPNNYYCKLISRDSNNYTPQNVSTPYLNLGGYKTSGIDFNFVWRVPLGGHRQSIEFNSVVNYVHDFRIQTLPGAAFQDFGGTINSNGGVGSFEPHWRSTSSVTYRRGSGEIGLRWHFIDGLKDATSVTSPASVSPGVPSYNTFDLVGRLKVNEQFELRAGMTNMFDKQPPIVGGTVGVTNPAIYDVIGRAFYMGAKVKY